MGELACHWLVETFKNFGEDMTGKSLRDPRCDKWILEMICDLEMLVHVILTVFSRGRSASGNFDIWPNGP